VKENYLGQRAVAYNFCYHAGNRRCRKSWKSRHNSIARAHIQADNLVSRVISASFSARWKISTFHRRASRLQTRFTRGSPPVLNFMKTYPRREGLVAGLGGEARDARSFYRFATVLKVQAGLNCRATRPARLKFLKSVPEPRFISDEESTVIH
jgi:hypothetical protein